MSSPGAREEVVHNSLCAAPSSSHSFFIPAWGPSHVIQSFSNYCSMGPLHSVQFSGYCSSMGPLSQAAIPAKGLLLCGLSQGMAVFSRGRSSMSFRRTICIIMVFLDCRESLTWHLGHLFPSFSALGVCSTGYLTFSFLSLRAAAQYL